MHTRDLLTLFLPTLLLTAAACGEDPADPGSVSEETNNAANAGNNADNAGNNSGNNASNNATTNNSAANNTGNNTANNANNSSSNNANNANNAADCPDLAGTWFFEEHCEPVLVGTEYVIAQTGCDLTVATVGWTGSVDADGTVTVSGPGIGGANMTCTGQATDTRLEAACSPACDVVIVR